MDRKEWEVHLSAAQREGKNVRQYAAEHGLSAHAMYSARRKQRRRETSDPEKAATKPRAVRVARQSAFAAVRVAATAPLRAQLPNGVTVELAVGAGDSATLVAAIDALAKLPCSA